MSDKDVLREFCHAHNIRVLDTNKRAYRNSQMVNYFVDPTNYNVLSPTIRYETEPMYTIEIPESDLERIANFENKVFNNMKKEGHYNIFLYMTEQKEREKALVETYPALKKAFEHYSLMLKLAESGEL
jgi:nucleotidyltransferase/DNA polymerase involved in DNA repair